MAKIEKIAQENERAQKKSKQPVAAGGTAVRPRWHGRATPTTGCG